MTLFTNLDINSSMAYKFTTLFCIKRLLVAYMTIFANSYLFLHLFIYVYTSIFFISMFITSKPMYPSILNKIEIMNESFMLFTSYYIIIFSGFFTDIEARYNYGFGYNVLLGMIVMINIVFIFIEIYRRLKLVKIKN